MLLLITRQWLSTVFQINGSRPPGGQVKIFYLYMMEKMTQTLHLHNYNIKNHIVSKVRGNFFSSFMAYGKETKSFCRDNVFLSLRRVITCSPLQEIKNSFQDNDRRESCFIITEYFQHYVVK